MKEKNTLANLEAEIDRLQSQWTAMKDEVNLCHRWIDRLQAALDAVSVPFDIKKAKVEIARLRAALEEIIRRCRENHEAGYAVAIACKALVETEKLEQQGGEMKPTWANVEKIIAAKDAEIARLQASKDEWIKQAAEMEAQRDKLRAAIEEILTANDRFRAQLPPDWEGDPINDACIKARKALAEGK